ncbi:polysaccharide deacetylase family protein [Flavobacteriaceae bacterium]|nr:polysaccharide deacetylase family protein [Flavobacteriaceae bacterium]
MPLRLHVIPSWLPWIFSQRLWTGTPIGPTGRKQVYLTFDDGPIPEITPWVLRQLNAHDAKATFFCIGENVLRHPEVFEQIRQQGHQIGNHTHHHLCDGRVTDESYQNSITAFEEKTGLNLPLFRPPYGRLNRQNAQWLRRKGYKIVMWHLLCYDWDNNISKEKSLKKVLDHIKPGSIIVLHDSLKAQKKMTWLLPRLLTHLSARGYQCARL